MDIADKLNVIGEIAGCAALGYGTRLGHPKAIILSGPGADNGKSQVLEILEGLLPKDAVCSIPLGKFGEERYLPQLAGKYLNTAGELTSATTVASDVFKTVVTGEPITGRDVYRSAVTFRPVAIHVFATNDLPGFRGGMDRGVRRRLLVVAFNRTIPEEERVVGIAKRITTEEADLLLHFAVEGACRLVRRGRFTEPASSGAALKEWMYGSDPVLAWLEEAVTVTSGPDAPAIQTKTAYAHFRAFAVSEGYRGDGLPAVNNFVQRVIAGDARIERGRKKEGGRFLRGIALKDPGLADRLSPSTWRG